MSINTKYIFVTGRVTSSLEKGIIERLEHLMYGHNYEVCFGINIFNGSTFDDFNKNIKVTVTT